MLLETKFQVVCLIYTRLGEHTGASASRCLVLLEFPSRPKESLGREREDPQTSEAQPQLRPGPPAPSRARGGSRLTLGDGDGLEAVELPQQAAPLGGVQAVDEVAGPLRRVQRLHRLLLGVGAERPRPPREEQPLGAAPQAAQAAAAAAPRAPQRAQAGRGDGGGAPRPPQQQRRPAEPRRHGAGEGRGARAASAASTARGRLARAALPRLLRRWGRAVRARHRPAELPPAAAAAPPRPGPAPAPLRSARGAAAAGRGGGARGAAPRRRWPGSSEGSGSVTPGELRALRGGSGQRSVLNPSRYTRCYGA